MITLDQTEASIQVMLLLSTNQWPVLLTLAEALESVAVRVKL